MKLFCTQHFEYIHDLEEWDCIVDSFIYASDMDDAEIQLTRHMNMLLRQGIQVKDWRVVCIDKNKALFACRPDTKPEPHQASSSEVSG